MFDRPHTFMLAALQTGLRRAEIILKEEGRGRVSANLPNSGIGAAVLSKHRPPCKFGLRISAVVLPNTFPHTLARYDTA